MNRSQVCFHLGAVICLVAASFSASSPADQTGGFYRFPHTDGRWIVFTSEGDLWKVPIEGGLAIRLTTHEGEERYPKFSPDGKLIAFTAQEDGQDDIFVIPAEGGTPKRLTFHPDRDQTLGWDREGNIIFRSTREIPYRGWRIYRISPQGGLPQSIGLDKGALISFEPGGERIAFTRWTMENHRWKRYQGGWAMDIWVGNLKTLQFENITEKPPFNKWQGDYGFPMWHPNGRIYFLSNMPDEEGVIRGNIHSMLPDGSDHRRHTSHRDFDVRFPALGGDFIVYQWGMDIWAYDIKTNTTRKVPIELPSDRLQTRVKYVPPMEYLTDFELSPEGKRLLLGARGEIFSAPTRGEGLIRQLTYTSGAREKYPRWSPDGKEIATWSDRTGEEVLYRINSEDGSIRTLGTDGRGWHFQPHWSPDGQLIAFGNEECELVMMETKSGKIKVIDRGQWEIRDYSWSPDSRFLAYSRAEANYNSVLMIYDTRTDRSYPITNDFYNSYNPTWSPDGKYLYFLSDREANPHLDNQEMTYILTKRTRPLVIPLKPEFPSPFAPQIEPAGEEEEEKAEAENTGKQRGTRENPKSKEKKSTSADTAALPQVDIEFKNIEQRILPVPIPAGNYGALYATPKYLLFLSWELRGMLGVGLFEEEPEGRYTLMRFHLAKKELKPAAPNIDGYDVSRNYKKLLIKKGKNFYLLGIDDTWEGEQEENRKGKKAKNESAIDLSSWDLRVDVKAEWRQIFEEAWRLQRDFFWDPNMHGVDWRAVKEKYLPLAERISTRDELNDLIGEMFAELNCSHTYIWGGDMRKPERHSTGLLGVDVESHPSGYPRIVKVYNPRPWDPNISSPLAAPAINAQPGDFIIAINGRPTNSVSNYLELLLGKADKVITVTLNNKPSQEGTRTVAIKPLGSEADLRYWEWVEGRRAYVNQRSNGKIGYIHLSDMGSDGLSQFAESYLPQHQKEGLIIDVRYNGGGFVAEMILSHLGRRLFSQGIARHGLRYRHPTTAFHGWMVAVCNSETGSDGETFTEGFKRLGLGPVFGTRTWGGWVGIRGDKPFIDRGLATQPEFTGWGLEGKWLIEGWGTDPDSVVVDDPASVIQGRDPSLDAAINWLLKKIAQEPKTIPPMPSYPQDRGLKP